MIREVLLGHVLFSQDGSRDYGQEGEEIQRELVQLAPTKLTPKVLSGIRLALISQTLGKSGK